MLDRARERWYLPVAVCGLLAWVQVADELALVAATAPIACVAAARLAMLALLDACLLREYWDHAALLVAAAASYELANVTLRAIRKFGGYYQEPLPKQLIAPMSQLRGNLHVMLQSIQLLFGASYQGRHPPLLSAELHWAGLGLAAAGLAVAVVTFFLSRTDRVSQIVAAANDRTLVAGVFGTLIQSLAYTHEVAILLPLGAVLAGRMLPPLLPARWWDADRERPKRSGRPATVVFSVLGVWLAAWRRCASPPAGRPSPPQQQLATWLASHHYTEGLSGILAGQLHHGGHRRSGPHPASHTAGGRRQALGVLERVVRPRAQQSQLRDRGERSQRPAGWPEHPDSAQALRPAGREYTVGPYVVMVYNYNLLTRLRYRAFPGVPGTG